MEAPALRLITQACAPHPPCLRGAGRGTRGALRNDRSVPPQDKVHIPGAIYLSVKFDPQCSTEEGCDELAMASSSDFQQDRHTFSGSQQKWKDFELPGSDHVLAPLDSMEHWNSVLGRRMLWEGVTPGSAFFLRSMGLPVAATS